MSLTGIVPGGHMRLFFYFSPPNISFSPKALWAEFNKVERSNHHLLTHGEYTPSHIQTSAGDTMKASLTAFTHATSII